MGCGNSSANDASETLAADANVPAPGEMPSSEEIRIFYEQAVSSYKHDLGLKGLVRGPRWSATLRVEHLQHMTEKMGLADLGMEELERVMRSINTNADGVVDLQEFTAAVVNGPASATLRDLIRKLRLGYNFGFAVPRAYDYSRSTNDNYKVDTYNFAGEFADLRRGRNYALHVNYAPERQRWQDEAIGSIVARAGRQPSPWLVFTCGAMGVGKGYAMSWMSKHGFFPLENIVHVDYDGFKLMMPEWPKYVEHNKETAGSLCHKESCFMVEVAQEAAMQKQQNIWIDSSMRRTEYYEGELERIRTCYPQYRIAIFYVEAEEETIRARIKERAEKTGRDVPEELIVQSLQAMDQSLKRLTPLCDFVARINNDGPVPVLLTFETMNNSGLWGIIKNQFAQSCSSMLEFPEALRPIPLVRVPEEYMAMLSVVSKGGAVVELLVGVEQESEDYSEGFRKLQALLPKPFSLTASPACKITMPAFARKLAGIPRDADSFLWVFPHAFFEEGQPFGRSSLADTGFSAEELADPMVQLFRDGGFCFTREQQVMAVLTVSSRGAPVLMQFGEPLELPPEVLKAIAPERFQRVTDPSLRRRQAESYTWILPHEALADVHVGGQHGAFAFRLEDGKCLRFPVVQDS